MRMLQEAIVSLTEDSEDANVDSAITVVMNAIQDHGLATTAVDESIMQEVLQKLREQNTGHGVAESDVFQVIDVFDVPSLYFHVDRKQFIPKSGRPVLNGSGDSKASVFRDRYMMLQQRTLRNQLFSKAIQGVENEIDRFVITPVEALLGKQSSEDTDQPAESLVIMGMLTQLQEGKFYLEDLDGCVQLNLSNVTCCSGLFTENCIVIAEGTYSDGVFRANTLGFPPPEPRQRSLEAFMGVNFFGGTLPMQQQQMMSIEIENEGAMFVILSDVWLDKPVVMDKLRVLFEGYSQMDPTPIAFVFMGNFHSEPYGTSHFKVLKDSFDALADLIAEFTLPQSSFIFVPGPQDPGAGNILPRPAIPDFFTEKMRRRVPQAQFVSNPARVRYCTQEIVLFREDIVNKMRRNCILPPSDEDGDTDISAHLVKTLVDQSHLCPLPLHVRPVYWEHDQALYLYPLPDVLVLADRFDGYNLTYEGCTAFNPGSFFLTDFSFMVYWPSKARIDPSLSQEAREEFDRRVEFSKID